MITAIAFVVVVIDDLRLRGKLRGVASRIKAYEVEAIAGIKREAVSILNGIKSKL